MSEQNKKNRLILIIIIVLLFAVSGMVFCYFQNEKEIASDSSNSKEKVSSENETPSPLIPPEEKWITYTSSELGFSIKYPEMVYGVNRCESKKQFYVPLKVFEDNEDGIVYITEEYYYEAPYDGELNKFTGPCEKIINSLEYLKSQREIIIDINDKASLNYNPFLTRVFVIKNIKNDTGLNKFIKDNYGSECFVKDKVFWKQSKIYDINIQGKEYLEGMNPNCLLNYIYKVLYAPEKNKAMSVKLGQECGFGTEYISEESYKCYDEEMIDSFEFE